MAYKSQLIDSTSDSIGENGDWLLHDNIQPFIMGINTPELKDGITGETLNSLISGVPSPWARAKLFWYAFHYLRNDNKKMRRSGLIEIFEQFINEWKGFIALIALFPDRVRFSDPIYLDGSTANEDNSLYDIPSNFGRMLFEDADLWSGINDIDDSTRPFIQLIYYKEQLIGATSPFSVVFPAIDYSELNDAKDIAWYRGGKFNDPTGRFTEDQKQKVFSFLENLSANIDTFENDINWARNNNNNNRLDLSSFIEMFDRWKRDLNKSFDLKKNIPSVKYTNLNIPFKSLLSSEKAVYIYNESMSFEIPAGIDKGSYEILDDLQDLLLDSDTLIGWKESLSGGQSLRNSAVYYLQVPNTLNSNVEETLYFSLPLSEAGINFYRLNMNSLLNGENSKLEGFLVNENTVRIELSVKMLGHDEFIKLNSKEYKFRIADESKSVVLWPNFTSDSWGKYYLFTDFPSNLSSLKFIPFFKQAGPIVNTDTDYEKPQGGLIEKGSNEFVYYDNPDDEKEGFEIKTETIVSCPESAGEAVPKYEILESNKPIAGLKAMVGEKNCGFILVRENTPLNTKIKCVEDYTDIHTYENVSVGFDFGSNNSCAYYMHDGELNAVAFKNRRVALVGVDDLGDGLAKNDELLFFQKTEIKNGQFKSWLHEHHASSTTKDTDYQIAGGVPVFAKNIQIQKMDSKNITTQAGKLHYNMKWLSQREDFIKKTAFLKTVWLQICSDLFATNLKPSKIFWSYPGAMSNADKIVYSDIFRNELDAVRPILGHEVITEPEKTESEAACIYALRRAAQPTANKILLGIDVGGSTSDILLLASTNNTDGNLVNKLINQSSVRLAAGVFFKAILNSTNFKDNLHKFYTQRKKDHKLKVLNIEALLDPSKANLSPYFLNSIFDQLDDEGLKAFYSFMGRSYPSVFTIPAYVTGLLLYYAGMLVADALEREQLNKVDTVELLTFGKGGRLFSWLDTFYNSDTPDYLNKCLNEGFGNSEKKLKLVRNSNIAADNKSEVAIGLVSGSTTEVSIDKTLREKSDIFGENGIKIRINGEEVSFKHKDNLKSSYFLDLNQISFPKEFEKFNTFLDIFLSYTKQTGMYMKTDVLSKKRSVLNESLGLYMGNDPEWIKAKELAPDDMDFRYSFIIAEGMCYLENVLIKEVFKD